MAIARLLVALVGAALVCTASATWDHPEIICAPKLPCTHTIAAGEDLWKVSEHYHVDYDEVVKLNSHLEDHTLVHVGDVINLPCKHPATNGISVADLLSNRPDMSILLKAATAAGFAETLSDPSLVATVFAPSNCRFKQLLAEMGITADQLLEDKDALAQVLSYHVVPGTAAKAASLKDAQVLPTLLEGQSLKVLRQGGHVYLETTTGQEVKVITADLPAGKAVVHIVGEVLLPDEDQSAPPRKCTHTVVAGEFLYSIAEKAGTDVETLLELNPSVTTPDLIQPGDEIKLPC